MDGYAVRAEDVVGATPEAPVTLPVVGEIVAGSAKPFAISAGTAVKIMTGAPIPRGADTVIPFERTDRGNARVSIREAAPAGANVRTQGSDVQAGDLVLSAGTVLGAREIGLLAALGAPRVKARPRPRVVIISTGSELREPGTHLDYDSIHDGNSYMLAAAVRAAGAIAYRVGAVDDNPRSFRKVLSEQLVRADLVVTSGGVSMGEKDVVKETLSALGTVSFDKVAMQPGKPQGFGRVFDEQKPIITLPGNPVSAYVSFEVFVLPAIRRMMGRTPYRRPMVHAVLASDLESRPGVRQYVRGIFEVTHRGAKVTPGPGPRLAPARLAREVQRAHRGGGGRDGAQSRRHRPHPGARQAVLSGRARAQPRRRVRRRPHGRRLRQVGHRPLGHGPRTRRGLGPRRRAAARGGRAQG